MNLALAALTVGTSAQWIYDMKLYKLKSEKGHYYWVVANHPTEAVEKHQESKYDWYESAKNIIEITVVADTEENTLVL